MKKLLFFLIILMISFQTFAIPAYPYPITTTQPNGEEVTLVMKGDEFIHWAVTLDGYTLLINSERYFCYAQLNESGDLEPSPYIATEISNRSQEVSSWLQSINKNLFYSEEQAYYYMQLREIVDNENENIKSGSKSVNKLLVILMDFPNRAFRRTQEEFNLLLNQINNTEDGITGSMKDYYLQTSYNKFEVTCTVVGPYTTPNPVEYYVPDNRWGFFARAAIEAAVGDGIDLAPFAENGILPSFYAIYAGYDQSAGCSNCIWAHKSQITPITYDGIKVSVYACSSELRGTSGNRITDIGVICHEFGHSLGAPDYYDTNYGTGGEYTGTGSWDIMAGGSWNDGGTTPPMHNPRSKIYTYGWATPIELNTPQKVTVPLSRIYDNAYFRINIPHSDSFCTEQFFIIENKDQNEFDAYIPGSDLIIYRCTENYSNPSTYPQNTTSPQRFYPVSANAPVAVPAFGGNAQSQYGSINSASCPWPGTGNKTSFTTTTTPAMVSWGGTPTNKDITNIQRHGDYITFDFMGGGSKSNYNVFLPAYYGCTVTKQSGSASPVNAGGNFSFTVDLLPSHNKSTIKVTANNVELTPSGNVYTISNIQDDQIVRIEDLKFNTFPISATAGENGIITPEGEVPVNQGGIQTFEIIADNGYSIDKVWVDNVDMENIKSYTFKNVLEPHSISATFKLGGKYIINSSMDSIFFETSTNIPSPSVEVIISSPELEGNISVTASSRFEISNNGNTWYKQFSINKTQLPYKLYIRFFPSWGWWNVGTFEGKVELKSIEAYKKIKLIGLSHVGIDEAAIENISIYPNPTTGELQVTSDELQVTSIEVYDVYGRKMSQISNLKSQISNLIDISHLNAGIYMIAVHTDKGIIHKKVIKE